MLAPAQEHMRGALAAHVLRALVAERAPIDTLEERFACAEQHRPHGKMQLIDQPRLQVLAYRRDAAADAHILATRGGLGLLERRFDAVGDEVKHRAAFHIERCAVVMRENEHRRVIGRLLAPPAAPALVGPGPAYRTEHVAPEDPGADAAKALLRHLMVVAGFAARLPLHLAPQARMDEPIHQLGAVDAQWLLQALVRTCAKAIERHRKTLDAYLRHGSPPYGSSPSAAKLPDPAPGVAEHFHPGRIFAEAARAPGVLHAAEAALRVRHDDGEAPVGSGEAGDALRGAARVVRIDLGRLALVIDVAHANEFARSATELCAALAMRGDDGNAAAGHAGEEERRAFLDRDHDQPAFELL